MNAVLNVLNYLATHFPWEVIVASGVLSGILVGVKKFFNVQSQKVMITLVGLVSGVAACAHYLLTVPTQDPSIIAVQTAVLGFTSQPLYFYLVKPAMGWLSETMAAAAAFRAQVESAAIPAGGIPGATKVEDFTS